MSTSSAFSEAIQSGVVVFDGANRVWLSRFGLAEKCAEINRAASRLAREAAQPVARGLAARFSQLDLSHPRLCCHSP